MLTVMTLKTVILSTYALFQQLFCFRTKFEGWEQIESVLRRCRPPSLDRTNSRRGRAEHCDLITSPDTVADD